MITHYRGFSLIQSARGIIEIPCFCSYSTEFKSIQAAKSAVDREIALRRWMETHESSAGFVWEVPA